MRAGLVSGAIGLVLLAGPGRAADPGAQAVSLPDRAAPPAYTIDPDPDPDRPSIGFVMVGPVPPAPAARIAPRPAARALPPDATPALIEVRYPTGEPSARAEAERLVEVLRQAGLDASVDPTAGPPIATSTIAYAYDEDRPAAEALVGLVGAASGPDRLARGTVDPRPGFIEINVAGKRT